jgi:hypothetical protein
MNITQKVAYLNKSLKQLVVWSGDQGVRWSGGRVNGFLVLSHFI